MSLPPPGLWLHRYRPGGLLGEGAHGAVYLAEDTLLGDRVAVKALPLIDPARADRIRREITALRALRVPGVVGMRDEGTEGDLQLIVMDRIDGAPFPGALGTTGWDSVQETVLALLDTLEVVHGAGIIHQDLKPPNVLLDRTDQPILLDFGLASGRGVGASGRHISGGTPRYCAPEQLLDESVGPSTDLYSLGVMIWEALTGALPHPEDGIVTRLFREPEPLHVEVPDVVRELLHAMLHRDPAQRPGSAAEVARILRGSWLPPLPPLSDPCTPAELQPLFHGPTRVLHLPERATWELIRCTGGRREAVSQELGRWVQTGVATLRDGRFQVTLDSLRRVHLLPTAPRAQAAAQPEDSPARLARRLLGIKEHLDDEKLLQLVRSLRNQARSGQAMDLLEAASWRIQGEQAQRELLLTWIDVALALGTPRALERALVELERRPLGQWSEAAFAVVRTILLASRGEVERAEAQLATAAIPPDLKPFARAAEIHLALRSPSARPEFIRSLRAEAAHDGPHRWRACMWLGQLAYTLSRPGEAAHYNRLALELAPTPAARFPAGINAVKALLIADRLDEAEPLARGLLADARSLHIPVYEARAECELRQVQYRRGAAQVPDLELVEALEQLDLPEVLGMVTLTEAAVAWRAEPVAHRRHAASLAAAAERSFALRERSAAGLLARALRLASASSLASPEEIAAVIEGAEGCDRPMIRAQILGLLGRVAPDPEPLRARVRQILDTLSAEANPPALSVRREVLSLRECADW